MYFLKNVIQKYGGINIELCMDYYIKLLQYCVINKIKMHLFH